MNTKRSGPLPRVNRAAIAFDRNMPWRRDSGLQTRRDATQHVAGNSPVPGRTVGSSPLEENLPVTSAAAPRTLSRPRPAELPKDELRQRFRLLADRWREETEFHSAISALYMHPAYQEIIGMGPAVLPLLLEDLATTRSDWFWALRAISQENPVPAEDRGKINRMTDRWLTWGHERGLL